MIIQHLHIQQTNACLKLQINAHKSSTYLLLLSQDILTPEKVWLDPNNTFWGGMTGCLGYIYPKRNVEHLGLYNLYMSKPDFWWKCTTPGFKNNNSDGLKSSLSRERRTFKKDFSLQSWQCLVSIHIYPTLCRHKEIIRNPKLQLIQKPLNDTITHFNLQLSL